MEEALVHGTSLDDRIIGNDNSEKFVGYEGDDYINGEAGDDIYIYSQGDGNDEIHEDAYEGFDTVKLDDLNADNILLSRDGNDLYITVTSTGETIEINKHFESDTDGHGIEQIVFADSTSWDRATIDLNACLLYTSPSPRDA